MQRIKNNLFIKSALRLIENNGIEFSGYLAFLMIFSIFPFLFILVTSISFLGETKQGEILINEILSTAPHYVASFLKPQIDALLSGPPAGLLNFIFIGALWTASSSVESLKQSFNRIYEVRDAPNFVISRIKSILQFICAIFVILLTMTVFIILPSILPHITNKFGVLTPDFGSSFVRQLSVSVILIVVTSAIYYSLTNKKLSFKKTLPGAAVCYLIWYVSADILSFYTDNFFSQLSLTYGSLATVVIILMFFYIINFALLYGAEINYQLVRKKTPKK